MIDELFDTGSANQVGEYESEDAALAVVRHAVRTDGPDAVATLALGREDEDGETTVLAAGESLARLAMNREPAIAALP